MEAPPAPRLPPPPLPGAGGCPRAGIPEAPAYRGRGDPGARGEGPPARRPRPDPDTASPRAPPARRGGRQEPRGPRTRDGGPRGCPQPEGITGGRAVLAQTPAARDLERGLQGRRAREVPGNFWIGSLSILMIFEGTEEATLITNHTKVRISRRFVTGMPEDAYGQDTLRNTWKCLSLST
ncbi:collagen alpha-1(III) chain-like isoform X4 [Cervus elaphus]|uniref:collagen alpha-1(III) chain-like isoform X4 n=1 Tax=Cervus elaphus TaxID=9860 RepID=UPI001CC28F56|nr:collagen alpha-1(III) chain-like isoform X4 [Cervus elaphus]